jgi:tetratricopeptide (TPR) repeat protein
MRLFQKYGTRASEVQRAKREFFLRLALICAVLIFFAGMLVITRFSPRLDEETREQLPEPGNRGDPLANPTLIRLRAEVDELLQQFQKARASGEVAVEELDLLDQAIEKQRRVISFRGSEIVPKADLDSLEELLSRRDDEMGKFLMAQSRRLQTTAEESLAAGKADEALEQYRRARNLQEEINDQYPRSSERDPSRLHTLNNRILTLETRPLAEEADRLRENALSLVEEGRYDEALEAMEEALEKQQTLNEEYRRPRFASLARLKQFRDTWKSVQVAEDRNRVGRLIEEARIALEVEDPERALALTEEAEVLQNRVMARFPESEEAGPEILANIQRMQDTASSLPRFLEIRTLREEVRQLLRTRAFGDLRNRISEWYRAVRAFRGAFPESAYLSRLREDEVALLHEKRDTLPMLLESVYRHLLPVPGHRGQLLYRSEVPQSLYEEVMGENPSQNVNPQLPVDSVAWTEARSFSRRLSWLLAYPVSLPTRLLFTDALGAVSGEEITDNLWSSQSTDRSTQPVRTSAPNDFGFYDLLGNVSEWLGVAGEEVPERVVAIGGSARDTPQRLLTIPEEAREPSERNRFVGFRFSVQTEGLE